VCFLPSWHGHLAREKRAISHELSQSITGKMPVPRYFATPSFAEKSGGKHRRAAAASVSNRPRFSHRFGADFWLTGQSKVLTIHCDK
jgi:hypothetical protein